MKTIVLVIYNIYSRFLNALSAWAVFLGITNAVKFIETSLINKDDY